MTVGGRDTKPSLPHGRLLLDHATCGASGFVIFLDMGA